MARCPVLISSRLDIPIPDNTIMTPEALESMNKQITNLVMTDECFITHGNPLDRFDKIKTIGRVVDYTPENQQVVVKIRPEYVERIQSIIDDGDLKFRTVVDGYGSFSIGEDGEKILDSFTPTQVVIKSAKAKPKKPSQNASSRKD